MVRWKYDISIFGGCELRRHITAVAESKDLRCRAAVIDNMQACLKVIRKMLQKANEDTQEVDDLLNLINGEADLVCTDSPLIADFGFDSPSDLVDERLRKFYDICDARRVWLGV